MASGASQGLENNSDSGSTATGAGSVREELLPNPQDANPQHCHITCTLIPNCVTKHWKCSCILCAVVLGVIIVAAVGLLTGIIVVLVNANGRNEHNITLSTYKEVLGLSATADHFFLEKLCIRAPEAPHSPPSSAQVQLATLNCNKITMTNASFVISGVLLHGLHAQQQQLVDHDLVFYWHKGTHIRLSTSLINFDERGVTIYILTNREVADHCSARHIKPKNQSYIEMWPVNLGSEQCKIFNDSTDFYCEFSYTVPQSDMHFICFYRIKYMNDDPRGVTYTYDLESNLIFYDTSLAKSVRVCDLNHSSTACCASYGGKFTGLQHKQCHFIKTDVPNNDNDLGIDFTVTVSSHQRLHVIVLFVGLIILCIIIAVILFILCVATLCKGKNQNVGGCSCSLSCHLYDQHEAYQRVP